MSFQHNSVITALALHVAEYGEFPQRERFRARQGAGIAAFDELVQWRELYVWDDRTLIVWTLKALARIEREADFARQELERARVVFDELVHMYQEELGRDHDIFELAGRVGFTHELQVRRALMLLQPLDIFDDFGVWLRGTDERFQISERILGQSIHGFPTRKTTAMQIFERTIPNTLANER